MVITKKTKKIDDNILNDQKGERREEDIKEEKAFNSTIVNALDFWMQ